MERTKKLNLRLSDVERDAIASVAQYRGCDVSNWARAVLLDAVRVAQAERVKADARQARLTPKVKSRPPGYVSPEELEAKYGHLRCAPPQSSPG